MNETKFYNCQISLGNISEYETEQLKKNLIMFLKCFGIKDYKYKSVKVNGSFQYDFEIHFEYYHEYRKIRFSQSILAFALYQGMGYYES